LRLPDTVVETDLDDLPQAIGRILVVVDHAQRRLEQEVAN
jgi:hypothetical protein